MGGTRCGTGRVEHSVQAVRLVLQSGDIDIEQVLHRWHGG